MNGVTEVGKMERTEDGRQTEEEKVAKVERVKEVGKGKKRMEERRKKKDKLGKV